MYEYQNHYGEHDFATVQMLFRYHRINNQFIKYDHNENDMVLSV